MAIYTAPVEDMRFILNELHGAQARFAELPGFEEATSDLLDVILEEAAKVCENELLASNQSGDEQGAIWKDGKVSVPSGYAAGYQALTEGGWTSLSCDPEFGGQGLPETIKFVVEEMVVSSNMALSLLPGLTHGAYRAIKGFASDELKARYLPKMVSGQWAGTMCLTESHCGTDLGLMRSRAEPRGDGTYAITGTKIFITGGDQDLTENIVHLVLAKVPGGPPGIKGVSLFLVPKYLPDADNSPGEYNLTHCDSIEKKMGIKGAPTCVMNFEGSVGWLVGEENRGMRAMFAMMNHERLWVGMQGLAIGESAYQNAAAYAKDRLQGRSPSGPQNADGPADPIIVHPDVRRMLMTTRAQIEAARALYIDVALTIDTADRHPDADKRARADKRVALMTPVIKAFLSDLGLDSAVSCQQVFGGHGYIREWGMEQYVRDARIAQIYEGTNGVQAMDLVGRKLAMDGGEVMRDYLAELRAFVVSKSADARLLQYLDPLRAAIDVLEECFEWLLEAGRTDPAAVGAAAVDFLKLMGLTGSAHMWAKMAAASIDRTDGDNTGFYQRKLALASYFMSRILPQTSSLAAAVKSGPELLMALEAEAF
jgi:alkylation response protein AidB-like acyl-CoA dehydrogenase